MKWFLALFPFFTVMVGIIAWLFCADTVATACGWITVITYALFAIFHDEFEKNA